MTTQLIERTRVGSCPGSRPRALIAPADYVAGVVSATVASQQVHSGDTAHDVALFAHLASLVAGFGAVLVVDWCGLRWLLRWSPLPDVLRVAGMVEPLIWLGLGGLLVSGVLLRPDLSAPLPLLKLAAVVVLGLNGLYAGRLRRRGTAPDGAVARLPLLACAAVSQLCWWTAVGVGFLSSQG
jgi:hypothetical protein